jgi:hypothetical protein
MEEAWQNFKILVYAILFVMFTLFLRICFILHTIPIPKSKCEGLKGKKYLICKVEETREEYKKNPPTWEQEHEYFTSCMGWTTESQYLDACHELARFKFKQKLAKEKLKKDEQKRIKKEEAEKRRLAKPISAGTRSKTKIKRRPI